MDKLTKLYKTLSPKERLLVAKAFSLLIAGDFQALDIKKLKGVEDVYRARIGRIRVIFHKEGSAVEILDVSRRNENTYRNY